MTKRMIAGGLWFLSTWLIVELVLYFAGGPRVLGPVIGAAAAMFVTVDPLGAIWPQGQGAAASHVATAPVTGTDLLPRSPA